jgi:predicted ATPase/DNA-binding SARP family transcriptional activator
MEFRILGPLEVRDARGAVALGGPKPRAVLAVLLLHPNAAVDPERIALALWGEEAPAGAVKTVQVHVSRLRSALGDADVVETTPAGYRLRVAPGELDAERFATFVEAGRRALDAGQAQRAAAVLHEALGLWRGAPLQDLTFESFAQAEIARLEEQRLGALEARIEADLAIGRHGELLGELQQLVAAHPTRERLAEHLMLALYRSGRQTDALAFYRETHRRFVDELGVEPGPELRALERSILNQDAELGGASASAVVLPARTTTLFGREADLEALAGLLDQARLVTLTGPGGVGKTSLALELARRRAPRFPDGTRFVELAPVRDPAHVPATVAQTLGVEIRDGELPREALVRFVAGRQLLLVLDNLEHVLDAAPLVAQLVEASPGLVLLCTSRTPLELSAERLYPVQPLEIPRGDMPDGEAVEMFCDRARARDPAFAITPGNARAVATICRRLDGLPLALELAAARMGFLSPDELAAGLDSALGLLVGGARDAPDRQRTLRATLDWGHRLLTDDERRAFARFAVFAGGATLEAALEVTEADLPTLESLAAKHLLTRTHDRIAMLEPIRQYAAGQLADRADEVAVRRRHARFCLRLAETVGPRLDRAGGRTDLAVFVAEADNLRKAIAFALAHRDAELALDLVCACGPWWRETNQHAEGRESLQAVLALAGEAAPAQARARGLALRGKLGAGRTGGEQQQRRADLGASLALFTEVGDTAQAIDCLIVLAQVEFILGLREQAIARADAALTLARGASDESLLRRALASRATIEPDHPDAARRARAAVPALVRANELRSAVSLLMEVGYTALADGRLDEARELLEDAVPVADATGSVNLALNVHGSLGIAYLFLGHDAEAADAARRSLEAVRAAGLEELAEPLTALGALAAREGDLEQAARLAGAAGAYGSPALREAERRMDEILDAEFLTPARGRLGEDRWDELAAEGARLGRLEAIELGLAAADRWGAAAQSDSSSRTMPATGIPTQSGRLLSS